jgi:ElaB/YqjD/DUF883 family membrane-anchored ribosome-binding protein
MVSQARQYTEKLSDKASQAGETITQTANKASQRVGEMTSHAREFMSEKIGMARDRLRDLRDTDVSQFTDDVKEYTRQNPTQAILIALGVGFTLGLFMRGSRS